MKEIPITSFDNLQIGQAENTAAGTGCTVVLLGKDGAPAGLDVRGGGPASSCSSRWRRHRSSTPLCWRAAAPSDWMPQAASCGISRNATSDLT